MPLPLTDWASFYVIAGSSGAALTGLMFVVIALTSNRAVIASGDGVSAFSTPTVTHFANVLLLSAVMTIPVQSVLSLTICLAGCATIGLVSTGVAGVRMGRFEGYTAVTEDWVWHVVLPFVAYLALLISAIALRTLSQLALVVAAVVVLLLLFIGIRNAWDVAVYLVIQGITKPEPLHAAADPAAPAAAAPPEAH
ncbi:MAG TPA: hypothetical protein VIJ16_00980 [Gemmatimonadaceae bacterium]